MFLLLLRLRGSSPALLIISECTLTHTIIYLIKVTGMKKKSILKLVSRSKKLLQLSSNRTLIYKLPTSCFFLLPVITLVKSHTMEQQITWASTDFVSILSAHNLAVQKWQQPSGYLTWMKPEWDSQKYVIQESSLEKERHSRYPFGQQLLMPLCHFHLINNLLIMCSLTRQHHLSSSADSFTPTGQYL